MKIAHYNTLGSGGSAVLMTRLNDELVRAGHDSRLRVRQGGQELNGCMEVEYCRNGADRLLERARYSMENRAVGTDPESYFSRTRLHRATPLLSDDSDCDLIHLHWIGRWLDLPSFLQSVPGGIPIIWTIHDLSPLSGGCFTYSGCDGFSNGCQICPLLPFPLNHYLAADEFSRRKTTIAKRQTYVVGNSSSTTEMARRSGVFTGARQFATIHPGIEAKKFRKHPKAEARRRLGLPMDGFTLGFGAAVLTDRNKGIHRFFDVVGKVRTPERACAGIEVIAVLFGDGASNCPVAGLPVYNLGNLDSERLSLAFSAMDVFLVTSKMETFGQVAIEAQACGTPVWAFDVGGLSDAINNEETGCLVPFPDTDAMANSIREAHEGGRLVEMSESAATWGSENFTAARMAAQYQDLYRVALGLD